MAILSGYWFYDILIFLIVLLVLYRTVIKSFNFWKEKGIPYIKPIVVFGNFKDVVLQKYSIGIHLLNIYRKYEEEPFLGTYIFHKPVLLIHDLDIVKAVLVKDFNHFQDRHFAPRSGKLVTKILFSMYGEKWKRSRIHMSPAFTSGKLKQMMLFLDECGRNLVKNVNESSVSDKAVDVKSTMGRYTTDVIASIAFGLQADSLNNPKAEFREKMKEVLEFPSPLKGLKNAIILFFPELAHLLNLETLEKDTVDYITEVVWKTVKHRESNGITRKDFLDLLLQLRKCGKVAENEDLPDNSSNSPKNEPENGEDIKRFELDGEDFVAQCLQFLVAGFETSANTMTFALYHLALDKEVQEKLRDEVVNTIKEYDGKLTYDALNAMHYLNMVVSETLRLYPILPFLDRQVTKTYEIPGTKVVLEKGSAVMIPVLGFHKNAKYFPHPEVFDPERFSGDNKKNISAYSYLPFGEGPRSCIGMRLGLLQAKSGLAHLLSNFNVKVTKNTPIPLRLNLKSHLMTVDGDVSLFFQKI